MIFYCETEREAIHYNKSCCLNLYLKENIIDVGRCTYIDL